MKTKSILLFILIVTLFVSCEPREVDLEPWKQLSLERTDYTGDKLRFDGCYYRDSYTGSTYGAYVFYYRNGVILSFLDDKGITNLNEFTQTKFIATSEDNWWLYKISGDTIISKKWDGYYELFITYYNLIQNDSTFQRIKSYNSHTGITTTYDNEIYNMQFIKMNPRPDSTNIFIK